MDDGVPSTPVSAGAVSAGADPRTPGQRRISSRGAQVIAAIAAGGVIGSSARYGVTTALPTPRGDLPVATLLVNTSGSLLIGVLMVLITETWSAPPLVRPFLGVGVLGGYTTFSATTVEVQGLVAAGRPGLALGYLAGTAVAALVAVQLGVTLTRAVALPRSPRHGGT